MYIDPLYLSRTILVIGWVLLTALLIFPEAFLNGALMAALVIYRPQWVPGFDESEYMRG